ncbi:hypothetical protein CAP35_08935 [Chitinophagaceae bacterium IBVUCB1]|nr:hypothetical protein CAP35_08935 [Chitinophagaceae bacterium IBVUCB1]
MKFYINIIVAGILLFASCTNKKATKRNIILDDISVSANNNPLNIYRAASTKEWEIVHTKVALIFNWKEKTANGVATLTLTPYFYATDSILLDAKTMDIQKIEITRGRHGLKSSYHKEDKLGIRFAGSYQNTDTIQIAITYVAKPYEQKQGGSAAINDDKGLYFINTDYAIQGKPAQIWTQGETEANSHWLPTIDKPNQRTTTEVWLTVPDSFTTLSNGYVLSQTPSGNGMRTDVWKMDKPIQVYAIMFAIGKYSIVKDREALGKEVSYYVEPAFAPYAKAMFKNTPEMIEFFSDYTGVPYPWNKYSQVVVRDYVSGAMENTSASTFGEFMNQDLRENKDEDHEDIVAHELFHQWFGDYVTAESWSNLTVNESFATYGEQLWRRHKYGKASVDKTINDDLNAYLSSNSSEVLVRFHYRDKEDMFDRVSYQKGSVILHYLHQLMGEDAFRTAMKIYLSKNALQPAEAIQWRLAVEEATGKDWNWFFNQWYFRGGHPELDIKYEYDDAAKQVKVSVTQKQKQGSYILPLKTALVYGKEKEIVDWYIDSKTETFVHPYKNGIKPIVIPDAGHWLVGTITDAKTIADWLAVFKASTDDVISRKKAIVQIKEQLENADNQAIITAALQDKEAHIRYLTVEKLLSIKANQLQTKWKPDIKYIAEHDNDNIVRATAIRALGNWKENEALPLMFEALSDSSYEVAAAGLASINMLKKDTAYTIAKRILQTKPRGELDAVVWEIIGEKGEVQDASLFENASTQYYGSKKIRFANALSLYAERVKGDDALERSLKVFAYIVKTEVIKSYRLQCGLHLLEVADAYKQQKASAKNYADKEVAEIKMNKVKAVMDDIIKQETDEGNKSTYKAYMGRVFN